MTSPLRNGPFVYIENDSPPPRLTSSAGVSRLASSHATPSLGLRANSPFHTHPSRAALLNSSESAPEPYHITQPSSSSGMDMQTEWRSRRPSRRPWPFVSQGYDAMSGDTDDTEVPVQDQFFIPSYLESSPYVRELEAAYVARARAQKDSTRLGTRKISRSILESSTPTLPPGSHRGLTHTIVERPTTDEDGEDVLASLPSRWNKDDSWGGLEVGTGGSTVKCLDARSVQHRDHEACGVRADHYMPPQCGIYYYEIQILNSKRDDTMISVGFGSKKATLARALGWEPESWGYHADDGKGYNGQNVGRTFSANFSQSDVIGCGVNFRTRNAFFTKNGVNLGVAFHNIPTDQKLYPAVSLKNQGEHISVNFGQTPFVYNIDDMMKNERAKIQRQIDDTDTSQLEPDMNEADLIQALVLQCLQHDGYVETARAFAEELTMQREAFNFDSKADLPGINIKDDEDANNRQRIRRAILEGDIDRALKHTNAYYPRVLKENEQVYFRLRCRRFIEMVRKAALLNMGSSQRMEIDRDEHETDLVDDSMETDASGGVELMGLEREMLDYGQALQAEYALDPRPEFSKALNDIWALVAYKNPLKEPQVSHMLAKEGRLAVSEDVNSAILRSLGKSSRAALDQVYAQASILLEDLREDGSDAAFISIQGVVESTTPQQGQLI